MEFYEMVQIENDRIVDTDPDPTKLSLYAGARITRIRAISVPGASTVLLVVAGLAGLGARAWTCRQRSGRAG